MPSSSSADDTSRSSECSEDTQEAFNFYVESEVVVERNELEFIPQQTIDSEGCYSYDDCCNTYCKTPPSKTTSHHDIGLLSTSESSLIFNKEGIGESGADTIDEETIFDECDEAPLLYDPYENDFSVAESYAGAIKIATDLQCTEATNSTVYPSQSSSMGIASYIADNEEILPQVSTGTPLNRRKNPPARRQPAQPWYCVSRPIHEQTRDLKISSVNKSSSIFFSRLVEKCRSIIEFCTLTGGREEINQGNITDMNYNHRWGDSLPSNAKGNTIRMVYQNVHRSINASDNPHTNSLLENLHNMEVDVFMAAETNINWKSALNRNNFQKKVSKIWPANRIVFSSSDIGLQSEKHEFLPGGTCTMAVDTLSMRVVKVGEDHSGLGRWSFLTMEGQEGRLVTFITAYRICKGAMRGISTSCIQQQRVLDEKAMKNGDVVTQVDTKFLRKKMVEDLVLFIKSLQAEGHAIVLGVDANETLDESGRADAPMEGSIEWLLSQTGLEEVFDLHHKEVPDSTTTTPGRFIDRVAVYGIPVQRVTLLRAHEPAKSDHLGIAVDLDLRYIFNTACSPLVQPVPRKLTSGNSKAVEKYVAFLKKQFDEHRIVERCKRLRQACDNDEFTDQHRKALYSLDREVTEILLGAENQCSKRKAHRNLWSPALQKAGREISYWKQRLHTKGQIDEGTRDLGVELNISATLQLPMSETLCGFYLSIAWKTYRGIQEQARAYREKFLKERAAEQAAKGNGDVAKAITTIRQREKLKSDYHAIRRGYGVNKQGLATLDTPDGATGGRRLITKSDEIHAFLLKRNEQHFSQATFTTFGDAGPGFQFIDPNNPQSDRHIDAMLDGTFVPWDSASPAVREFLAELKCQITKMLEIKLHLQDFKNLFKKIPETTASSVSGLHYGHYRVLSKLDDETYIKVLFDLVDIAFITHSPLPRWQHATQLMLEKGKGPAIENLRIIQILEADMNWLLRLLWGKNLDRHALDEGVYNDAQFASPGKLCQSAIVNKALFFDLLRQTRQYGALADNDATAAFDRVLPALCVVTCNQLGMPKIAQRFFFKLLRQMTYTTTTAHGRSMQSYSASANPRIPGQGVMQGGGASLPNYKSQQLPVIRAYEHNCVPAVFRPASKLTSTFRRWVSGFSDDISLFLNELGVKLSGIDVHMPMAQRLRNVLQHNLQKYEEYFFTAGGSLNLKKCFYYLVGFKWTGTEWRFQTNTELGVENIEIIPTTLAGDGVSQQVHWCEANEAQRTLGSFLAPDGSFFKQLDVLMGKLNDWQRCLRNIDSSNLQARWLSFKTVFLKKIMYPLIGHSCGSGDLHSLQQQIDREVLHILGLNEHFSRAALYAPLKYGGMGCITIHGQHVIDKLLLFVYHIRENRQMRETFMASMSITQIECGMPRQFFSLPANIWHALVTPTWISHIWRECQPRGIEIKFHTECMWIPQPVRERDRCIMEIAASMYNDSRLYQINMCRLALQVTYVSDIASVDGRRILLAYYKGLPHKESGRRTRLNWPPVGKLPESWWATWRNFITAWCGTALQLPEQLGAWYREAEMLTQCCFFTIHNRLIMQQDRAFFEFSPYTAKARKRFHTQATSFVDLHLLASARVVDITFKSNSIFVISSSEQRMVDDFSNPAPVGSFRDLYRDLSPELQRIIGYVAWPDPHDLIAIAQSVQEGTAIGVSDGSVREIEGRASQAWIIQTQQGQEIRGHGPVDCSTANRTSHRAELQGQAAIFLMLSLIVRYFGIFGGKLQTYCDNQAVVHKLKQGWRFWRYKHTKGPDGDLQALLCTTINALRTDNQTVYGSHWVKGHQDRDGDVQSLPRQVGLNVRMDKATHLAYDLPASWQTHAFIPVLKAEGCAVYIGDAKLTTNIHLTLSEQWHDREAREYLFSRHGISSERLLSVNWRSMRFSLRKLSSHRRATAVKAIHRHLPTQEKLYKQGRLAMTSLCPRCLQHPETNSHIYCCLNEHALKQRKADWRDLWAQMAKIRTAQVIERVWRQQLHRLVQIPLGESMVDSTTYYGELDSLIQLAIKEQSEIGWDKLMLGMGSNVWKTIQGLVDNGNPHPPKRSADDWMNAAIYNLLKFSLRCWKERNSAIHGATRQERQTIALQQARDNIRALYASPPTLAPQFRSIQEIPLEHRLKMPLNVAEQWLALIAHQVRVTQHNLQVLLRQHQPLQNHFRTMRRIARNQTKERSLPTTPRKAHSRAVQAAVKQMREKLYSKREVKHRQQSRRRRLFAPTSTDGQPAINSSGQGVLSATSLCPSHVPVAITRRRHPP